MRRFQAAMTPLLGVLVLVASAAHAMTVTQVIDASGGGPGAALDSPWGIVSDAANHVYVVGFDTNNVLERAPDGTITEILDGSGDGVHPLTGPESLAIAPDGTLYVACVGSDNVFKRPPGGAWTQIVDASGDGVHPLQYPHGLATDAAGNVFVADTATDSVFRVDAAGVVTRVVDGTGDGLGHTLDEPQALATDGAGNLYVAGQRSNNVLRVTPAGTVSLFLATSPSYPLTYPSALATHGTDVYVGTFTSRRVFRIAAGGAVTQITSGIDARHLVARDDGLVFVSGSNVRRIIGVRPGGPDCLVIDDTGDGTNPFGIGTEFTYTPAGDVFASAVSWDAVFRIADACQGPSFDLTGRWYLTLTGSDGSTSQDVQDWVQSGFAITVTDPDTNQVAYTGTIDDRDHVSLASVSQVCNGFFCCTAQTIVADANPDGSGWGGTLSNNGFVSFQCGAFSSYSVVANRCGNGVVDPGEACEDGNEDTGDGCDPSCRLEPCWACAGSPSVCAPAPRACTGITKTGGVSLKVKAAVNGRPASFKWQLSHGAASTLADLGDPTTTTAYDLCIFDRSGPVPALLLHAKVPPGSEWKPLGAKGFSYKSGDDGAPDGIQRLRVQSGTKSKISLLANGPALQTPALPLALPLTIELITGDACFSESYSSAGVQHNDAARAQLRADP